MKIVFFGTPLYVVPVIDTLHKRFKSRSGESPIAAVVTQNPKPAGRKQLLRYSPVDTWAHKKKLPIYFKPEKILQDKITADVGVLASYGEIIPKSVIDHFPNGILNIHPSLLPKFRGSSPVQATLVAGDLAGSTIIKIDSQLDHGPIVSQFEEEILPDDTTLTLRNRLFERSAAVLADLLEPYIKGRINLQAQEHKKATFTKQIRRNDAYIPPEYLNSALQSPTFKGEWNIPFIKDYVVKPSAKLLERFIRAMQPWPQAWTTVKVHKTDKNTKRLKVLEAHLNNKKNLVLERVQLEGKNEVSWKQFKEGYPDMQFT